jgi:hypothetical protein
VKAMSLKYTAQKISASVAQRLYPVANIKGAD